MENPLENSLGFQMTVAARSMKHALDVKLAEHGVTSSQYVALEILWQNNGLSISDLGKELHFDNPTLSGIINRLVHAKLIRRSRDRNDRRVIKVFLTDRGRELSDILPKVAEDVNKRAVENFSKKDKKAILDLAKRVHSNLKNNG